MASGATSDQRRAQVLLCSGYWGLTRHFHYIAELLACYLWTVRRASRRVSLIGRCVAAAGRPAESDCLDLSGVSDSFALVRRLCLSPIQTDAPRAAPSDRAYRDEVKCAAKYGKFWTQYCELVPYRVIPYVY